MIGLNINELIYVYSDGARELNITHILSYVMTQLVINIDGDVELYPMITTRWPRSI